MTEQIRCECGCGALIPAIVRATGKPRHFLNGHQNQNQKIRVLELGTCACGCGKDIITRDRKNRVRSYALGHRARPRAEVSAASAKRLDQFRPATPWNKGKTYVFAKRTVYANKGTWVKALKRLYADACMVCGWDESTCDGHHIVAKSQGGPFTLDNGILLCPNHHRLAHGGKLSAEQMAGAKQRANILAPTI